MKYGTSKYKAGVYGNDTSSYTIASILTVVYTKVI